MGVQPTYIKFFAGTLTVLLLASTPVFANTVIDTFSIVRRQMMRNEEMQQYVDIMRNGSADVKKLAITYNCSIADGFDERCQDWALHYKEDTAEDAQKSLEKPIKQMEHIREIIGINEPLGDKSIAYQYLRCLAGTKNKGIKNREIYDVEACKDIPNWDYAPIMIEKLAEQDLIQKFFAPDMKYYVVRNEDSFEIVSRPKGGSNLKEQSFSEIKNFIHKNMATNICDSEAITDSEKNIRAETRNVLAQAYAVAVASRRAGELFDEKAYPYMQTLLKDPNLKMDNLRKGIHLWIAADSSIIWQLGQINAIQGLMTEIKVLSGIGGVKTLNGQIDPYGEKSQKEVCGNASNN